MKVVEQLKKEKGAATIVEASIIMPIVFIIVCFLFIMGVLLFPNNDRDLNHHKFL